MINKNRVEKYQKDENKEELLKVINEELIEVEDKLSIDIKEPALPVIFIVGLPRSGTTLVSQLIADHGGFSYISNFLARFWKVPRIGSLIEQGLNIRNQDTHSSYVSDFGATNNWSEPHEFTYFWDQWFNMGQEIQKLSETQINKINIDHLKKAVACIEYSWGGPVLFKNPFWCNFQIKFLSKVFPNSIFVLCQRAPLYVAQSITIARKKISGNKNVWWSIKPEEYHYLKHRRWDEQIIGQVYYTLQELQSNILHLSNDNIIYAKYDDFCKKPGELLRKIIDIVNNKGANIEFNKNNIPTGFTPEDKQKLPDEEFNFLMEMYYKYF